MATFRQIVECVEDNNSINDGQWNDWSDANHILYTYGPLEDEDINEQRTAEVLTRAVKSNGASLADDLRQLQLEIMGQNFAGSWWNR